MTRWLTTTQAAKLLGVTASAVAQQCRRGAIPYSRESAGLKSKQYMLLESDVLALKAARAGKRETA